MRTKRWTSDCGEKWYEIREDGTVGSFKTANLTISECRGARYINFSLIMDRKVVRIHLPIKVSILKYFVDNPKNLRHAKFTDDNPDNFHANNITPVKTHFESLTTSAQQKVLDGRVKAEETRRIKEEALNLKLTEMEATNLMKDKAKRQVAYRKAVRESKGKIIPSSVFISLERIREKNMGYVPKHGLFGKKTRMEEPKYDSNFKLIK